MRVVLAQISPALGDSQRNFDLHLESIAKARREKAELIVFPELSLTGYLLKDLVETAAVRPEEDGKFRELLALSREISIVLGFVEEKERGLFFNSAAFLSGQKILAVHRKVFLPTFGMFEEKKFFAQGKNFNTFQAPFGKTGMMICRDFLNTGAAYLFLAGGAEVIIVLSAAPGRGFTEEDSFATSRMWELMGEAVSFFSNAFVFYCNRAGFEDGMAFAGGSFIFSPQGTLLARGKSAEPDFLVQEIDIESVRRARKNWPFKRDDRPEIILQALKRIVDGYED